MKVSKNKIKALVMEAMSKTLNEESEFGNLTGEVTKNITNSKGGTVKIPNGYYKMPGTRLLTAEKGDPYEYTALINAKTEELAFMPVMDKKGGTSTKLNVGRVFDKGHKAHTKLLKRYNENFPNELEIKKKIESSQNKSGISAELMSAFKGVNMKKDIINKHVANLASVCQIYANPKSSEGPQSIFGGDDPAGTLDVLTRDHAEAIKNEDPFYRLALHQAATKGLDGQTSAEVEGLLSDLGLEKPTKEELAKSALYKDSEDVVAKSALFKDLDKENPNPDDKTVPTGKERSDESREINENRIRAIIRHELIQSMRK
jgi:hypothetical protein